MGIHWIADTRRVRVWIQIHTHERLWVRIWIKFCLAGMDSRTIYGSKIRHRAIQILEFQQIYSSRHNQSKKLPKHTNKSPTASGITDHALTLQSSILIKTLGML